MVRIYYAVCETASLACQHATGRGLLLRVLGAREEDIQYLPNGKPFLSDGPHFNLSHSHLCVMLAVSDEGEVGCDIEYLDRTVRNKDKIIKKLGFSADGDFLTQWVLYEARQKAGGAGETTLCEDCPPGYVSAVCRKIF